MNAENLANQVNLLNNLVHALTSQKSTLKSENQRLYAHLSLFASDHNKVVAECTSLRQKNQQLLNSLQNNNSQVRRFDEMERILGQKQKEVALLKTENKHCQTIIGKNNETIKTLSLKNNQLERLLQTKTEEYTQTIRDLECNKLPQIMLQNQLKGSKIAELNQYLAQRQTLITQLELKLAKQAQAHEDDKLNSDRRMAELSEQYNQIKIKYVPKQTAQKNINEINLQFIKREDQLNQKIIALEREINRLEQQINVMKLNSFVLQNQRVQKEREIMALKKIMSEQEKRIEEQKLAVQKLPQILSLKDKQIQNLETSNSMLRKQIVNSLTSQESARREMLMHKEQLRKSKGSIAQIQSRNSRFSRKKITVLTEKIDTNMWGDAEVKRSDACHSFMSQKNVDGTLKQKIKVHLQDPDMF